MAEQPAKKDKRQVKNPETFRERALKASEASEQPKRGARVKQAGTKVSSPLTQAVRKLFGRKPFSWLAKPLRLIGKIIFPTYFRNSWKELKLVTWPTWQQSRQLTFAVLIFAAIFGASVALVDYGLDKVFRHILLK